MSEPIKQTLFRFKSMRAPQLVGNQDLIDFFVQHFDGESGVFFTAVDGMEPEENREVVLETAISTFEDNKTKDELIAFDSDLYELGLYLLRNRKKTTLAEATTAVGSLTALSSGNQELVWDNLFYQTITGESSYAREVCLVLLLANHFVEKFATVATDDKSTQYLAGARVIMPVKLFDFDLSFISLKADNENSTNFDLLNSHIENAEKKMAIDQLNALATEIEAYKNEFYKTNNALEKAAIIAHQAAYKTEIDTATTEDSVDQFSEFTFKRYTDFEAPVLSYSKPIEIDSDPMGEFLTIESFNVANRDNLFNTKTFEEFENKIQAKLSQLNGEIFQRTDFRQEKMAIEGNLISKCNLTKKYFEPYGYVAKVVERTTGNYNLFLTIDIGDDCDKMTKATTTQSTAIDPIIYNTVKSVVGNGIFTIDLVDGVALDLSEEEGVTISTQLEFSSGRKLAFDTTYIEKGGRVVGNMISMSLPNSQPDLKIPSGYGLRQLVVCNYKTT